MINRSLSQSDPDIYYALLREELRQEHHLELIASENYASRAVMEAQGSVFTNKYAEGYPGKRYYGGCEHVDVVEELAITRLKDLYGVKYANVQPHSGSQANQAVMLALLNPGDTIMGMDLSAGGHLTHGMKLNMSGKWFNVVSYGVNEEGLIDYDQVRQVALTHRPRLIIAGASAYSRQISWSAFASIAREIGAYFMVDMAHYSGLIAGEVYPTPVGWADVITSTTHKTLRGPRGGFILTNDEDLSKRIDRAVFPGTQGGPLMHVIAAKAVAFEEALQPSFKNYANQVITNARILAQALNDFGLPIISGGTDSHLMLVDTKAGCGLTGAEAEQHLSKFSITCNKNGIPNDKLPPTVTSGIRLGTAALTTRGMDDAEMYEIGKAISQVLRNGEMTEEMDEFMADLPTRFPVYWG